MKGNPKWPVQKQLAQLLALVNQRRPLNLAALVALLKNQRKSDRSSEDLSFARAKNFVEENANLQTAGIALAGAGLLALVSTVAGRSLMRTAATTVAKLATDNFGEYFGSADSDSESDRQTPSRQRDQARN